MSDQQQSEKVTRAMAVFAHPDDAEFGCGGTIAKWVSEGIEFIYVVATDWSKGSADPEMSPYRLIPMRPTPGSISHRHSIRRSKPCSGIRARYAPRSRSNAYAYVQERLLRIMIWSMQSASRSLPSVKRSNYLTLTRSRLGTRATMARVATMQATPPLTTESSGVKNPATRPDSTWPSMGPPITNMALTAL